MAKKLEGIHIKCAGNGFLVTKQVIEDPPKKGQDTWATREANEDPYVCEALDSLLDYIEDCIEEHRPELDDDKKGAFSQSIGHKVMKAIAKGMD